MKNIGLVISVAGHVIVLGVGLFTLTAPLNFAPDETVYIPIEMTEFADTASARKGDETAPLDSKPAPKPTNRPLEDLDAKNVGEGQLDTTAPYKPKEKDRQVEAVMPNAGKPDAQVQPTPPEKPNAAPIAEQTPPPLLPKPTPEPTLPQPEQKTTQETVVSEPKPSLPTNNIPLPNIKPRQQAEAKPVQRGDESVDGILAKESALINKQRTQGGGARASNTPAAQGGDKNVGDDKLAQTVATIIGGCIQRQFNIGALAGRDTAGLLANIRVSLTREGEIIGTPTITPQGGDNDARDIFTRQAYTAVFTCQSTFKQLPADKYNQWRDLNLNVRPPVW